MPATKKPKKTRAPATKSLNQTRRNLDKVRGEHDPDPERVLVALLGWWAGIEFEVGRVSKLLEKFQCAGSSEFRPKFKFLEDVRCELNSVDDALVHGRPMPESRGLDDLVEEVNMLLPAPDRDEEFRDAPAA